MRYISLGEISGKEIDTSILYFDAKITLEPGHSLIYGMQVNLSLGIFVSFTLTSWRHNRFLGTFSENM